MLIFLHDSRLSLTKNSDDNIASQGQKTVYFGKPNPSQESCSGFDVDICPDLVLAGFAIFGVFAFLALFIAFKMNAAGRRKRRKRSDETYSNYTVLRMLAPPLPIYYGRSSFNRIADLPSLSN
jgi:hypothetical protein